MNNTNIVIQKLKSYKFINPIVNTDPYIIAQEKNALVTINGKLKIKGKAHQFTEDFIAIPKKEVQFYSYDNFSNRWLSQ